jgi:hypothetical protein
VEGKLKKLEIQHVLLLWIWYKKNPLKSKTVQEAECAKNPSAFFITIQKCAPVGKKLNCFCQRKTRLM